MSSRWRYLCCSLMTRVTGHKSWHALMQTLRRWVCIRRGLGESSLKRRLWNDITLCSHPRTYRRRYWPRYKLGSDISSCGRSTSKTFRLGMYRISGSGSGWPDIRPFFSNPVPAPAPAKMVPGRPTGYLSRTVLSLFCAFRASLQHCRRSHYWTSSTTAAR